jgi:hypothetical protein
VPTTRLADAAAGNYDSCISIKMGSDIGLISQCSSDGNLRFPPKDTPNQVECFLQKIP